MRDVLGEKKGWPKGQFMLQRNGYGNVKSVDHPSFNDYAQLRCSWLCAPAGLFGAHFHRREAAHWAIGRLQASSG
jgi:hypothetical protein